MTVFTWGIFSRESGFGEDGDRIRNFTIDKEKLDCVKNDEEGFCCIADLYRFVPHQYDRHAVHAYEWGKG